MTRKSNTLFGISKRRARRIARALRRHGAESGSVAALIALSVAANIVEGKCTAPG